MKANDTKMEITTEKESMTNSDFSRALAVVLNTMSNKILLDKKEYDELIKIKSTFDTEMKTFITKYTSDRDLAYMKYNNKVEELEKQITQKDAEITRLTLEVDSLCKQIKKQNKRWTIF
jgi:hypothetical protein